MPFYKNPKGWIGLIVSILGLIFVFIALMAGNLGMDPDSSWGPARKFMFYSGLALSLMPYIRKFLKYLKRILGAIFETTGLSRLVDRVETRKPEARMEHRPEAASLITVKRRVALINLTSATILCLVMIAFTWLISVGRWTDWQQTTNYFHLLAEGFRNGQVNLAVDPPEDLLALPNPYDVDSRKGLRYLWDASLYRGKYYLYWGPTPALITLLLETILPGPIGDHVLVWFFALASSGIIILFVRFLWLKFFSNISIWAFPPIALIASFANPIPWMLARPAVYEVAILSAQFFFLCGVFSAIAVMTSDKLPSWRLLLVGLFWSMAVGSRITLVAGVIILTAFMILWLWLEVRQSGRSKLDYLKSISLMAIPLMVGALCLAWYNYVRFDSIFEVGHRYQLGRSNILANYSAFSGVSNLPQNIFNYFLNPFRTLGIFPYIKPTWGKYAIPFLRFTASSNYHTEQGTGVLFTIPFVVFSLLPMIKWIDYNWQNFGVSERASKIITDPFEKPVFRNIYLFFISGFVFTLSPLLILSINSMRHQMDFIPSLLLLGVISLGNLVSEIHDSYFLHKLIVGMLWALATYSVLVALLLAITGYNSAFETFNPSLFHQLEDMFSF